MKLDWTVVYRDKQKRRHQFSERPVAEKLRALERRCERTAVIKRASATFVGTGALPPVPHGEGRRACPAESD